MSAPADQLAQALRALIDEVVRATIEREPTTQPPNRGC